MHAAQAGLPSRGAQALAALSDGPARQRGFADRYQHNHLARGLIGTWIREGTTDWETWQDLLTLQPPTDLQEAMRLRRCVTLLTQRQPLSRQQWVAILEPGPGLILEYIDGYWHQGARRFPDWIMLVQVGVDPCRLRQLQAASATSVTFGLLARLHYDGFTPAAVRAAYLANRQRLHPTIDTLALEGTEGLWASDADFQQTRLELDATGALVFTDTEREGRSRCYAAMGGQIEAVELIENWYWVLRNPDITPLQKLCEVFPPAVVAAARSAAIAHTMTRDMGAWFRPTTPGCTS